MSAVNSTVPFVIENHDEAYHVWRRAAVTNRTLVHVDAHHDMAWLDHAGQLSIGNYVCQAIKDGIVGEVVWVVPDASWDTPRARSVLLRHLKTLARESSAGAISIDVNQRRISTRLLDIRVTVCALDTLQQFAEPVLLDIDTDFLTLRVVEFSGDDRPGELPWMWPEELAAALHRTNLMPDIVTIAYSVTGGYTPLRWKYLGDELSLAWMDAQDDARMRAGYQSLRDAALTEDPVIASAAIEHAAHCLPQSAAPHYHRALLHLKCGNEADARRCFARAFEVDPACRGPYSSRGYVCLAEGRAEEAAAEFTSVLALDPGNPFAMLGLARIAALNRRWVEAEAALSAVIAASPRLVDAYRCLGDVLVQLGRDKEAGAAYERCLKLALDGEASVEDEIHTPVEGAIRHERHDRVHAALAGIDARAGRLSSAISGYRIAIAAGADVAGVRSRLALLYVRQGSWAKALQEAARAFALLPREVRKRARRVTRH